MDVPLLLETVVAFWPPLLEEPALDFVVADFVVVPVSFFIFFLFLMENNCSERSYRNAVPIGIQNGSDDHDKLE